MIRDNMIAALLHERLSTTVGVIREAIEFLSGTCRDGMTDGEIGITLDRISPMMRSELIQEIRIVALRVGIILSPAAETA